MNPVIFQHQNLPSTHLYDIIQRDRAINWTLKTKVEDKLSRAAKCVRQLNNSQDARLLRGVPG